MKVEDLDVFKLAHDVYKVTWFFKITDTENGDGKRLSLDEKRIAT